MLKLKFQAEIQMRGCYHMH